MTPTTFQRVRELFAALRELSPAERSGVLDRECGVGIEDAIRAEVQSLLEKFDQPGPAFLDTSPVPVELSSMNHLRPAGETLGEYRLGQVLGVGGMGIVYEAQQEHPRRTVALKLIRPLFVSPDILRRFEHEADVLARLEHPGIARIYEAGTFRSPAGPQPFFAMELVRGRPLRKYVTDEKPSTQKRLELFRKICDAVQHAHQKGVIHRDLKPGNILVTDEGEPKVLDFGVARAVNADAQSITMNTQTGQLVGTLPYMSPEQVSGDVNAIDTRSDVYALGVIAYELLAGQLPFAVLNMPLLEAARIIREDEPSRLSAIRSDYRGDIETIVAKALEKEKERRYASAGAIAADITRYLNYEPISARPPSAWYHASRFGKRHRVLVTSVIAVILALMLGLGGTIIQLFRARRAEAEMRVQKNAAQSASATKDAVREFLENMLSAVDPNESPAGKEITVSLQLDRAARTLDSGAFAAQPLVESEVRQTIGSMYVELGRPKEAETQLNIALAARRRAIEKIDDDPFATIIMKRLFVALHDQGRLDEAATLHREVLARNRRLLGDNHPETIESLKSMGAMLLMQRKVAEAEPYINEALQRARATLPEDDPLRLSTIENTAGVAYMLGKYEDADRLWRELLATYRKMHGDDDDATLRVGSNLAMAQNAMHRPSEAKAILRDLLTRYRRKLGSDHPQSLDVELKLALVLGDLARTDEAEQLLTDVVNRRREKLGPSDSATLQSMGFLNDLRARKPATTSTSR